MNGLEKKPVIICVDDEKFVLDTLHRQLQRRFQDKFEYELAESAEEAIEIIDELAEDGYNVMMVISDQVMPGMKGDVLLSKIFVNHPSVVSILLTGQASMESAINVINSAHLYRYLTKPWDMDDFLLTVEKGVEKYSLSETGKKQLEVFRKFVPDQFLVNLNKKSILDIKLGDNVEREMTVLFADIAGFTSLSEKMSPSENFAFINSYLKYIEPAIVNNNGFIDKYIGDGVLALFDKPTDAVNASIAINKSLMEYNEERKKEGLGPIKTTIGLHTGELMLGIVGVSNRMQGTVISDAVNLASRMQGLASIYGASLIISDSVLNKLENVPVNIRFLGKFCVKGKQNEVSAYEVLDADPQELLEKKLASKVDFDAGLDLYFNKRFAEASVKFDSVFKNNTSDKAAKYYLEKSALYLVRGVADDWNGIEIMEGKA